MGSIQIDLHVPGRMRYGIRLDANIFRPAEPGRYPVLVSSAYDKETNLWWNLLNQHRAVAAGYVVIAQDCRERFASEGEFQALLQEGPDGMIRSSGQQRSPIATATWECSAAYYGFTQWSTVILRPPHLEAIAPTLTWADYGDGGSFRAPWTTMRG